MANQAGHSHAHEATATLDLSARHVSSASVALDIGGNNGALVIYPDERFRDREIELSQRSGDGRRVHTGVHERPTPAGSTLTAVFGCLEAGEYVIWLDDCTAGPAVTISAASVTEVALD
jgi:hypothetical protein